MCSLLRIFGIVGLILAVSASSMGIEQANADTIKLLKIPQVKVPRTKTPIIIDGKIEQQWNKAPILKLVANNNPGAGSEVSLHSEARVMFDSTNLYVLYIFEDPSVRFAYVNPDDMLWDSGERLDLAELLLQPDNNQDIYYEFAVNPAGALLDAQVKWKRGQPTWNISWPAKHPPVAAKKIEKNLNGIDGWCVEMAIPFNIIGFKPNKGSSMRANFHRADVDLSAKWLSWSPTITRSIHVPGKFGKLTF